MPTKMGTIGMDAATVAAIIAALALVMNLVAHFLSGGWKLGAKLSDMENSLRKAISDSKDEIEQRQDTLRREIGETIAALRQKVNEVELEGAKTYIRRDSFYQVRAELTEQIKSLSDKFDVRCDRMEAKIDRA